MLASLPFVLEAPQPYSYPRALVIPPSGPWLFLTQGLGCSYFRALVNLNSGLWLFLPQTLGCSYFYQECSCTQMGCSHLTLSLTDTPCLSTIQTQRILDSFIIFSTPN